MKKALISGNIVDVLKFKIYPGTLEIAGGKIAGIKSEEGRKYDTYIIPGLVDAHIHIESSMMVPAEFARIAVIHGTVATVSDPHEIANVLGSGGVRYMIASGRETPFKFYFGAPSCVPATGFETAGGKISAGDVEILFKDDGLKHLSEMMNFPGVLYDDPGVIELLRLAQNYNKPVDGHAPGLRGAELLKYINAGITTDHEAFRLEEALEKIKAGMKILIREGTAAKNFEALHSLIDAYDDSCMFCSDDKHPNDLVNGHINEVIKRALQLGHDKFKVLRCATVNPVRHYGLDVGLLQAGDPADLVIIDDFNNFNILATYINGKLVAQNNKSQITKVKPETVNNFNAKPKRTEDFVVKAQPGELNVIEAIDGEIITRRIKAQPKIENGQVVSDTERDILKISVVNRYQDQPPAVGFIKNFGLKRGAIASSVAHDSHNILVVGVSDEDMARAVNAVIENKGGLVVVDGKMIGILPLPVAGLMSTEDGNYVASNYEYLANCAKELGSQLKDPYMTLSFMALLVIPDMKISDKGLFDGKEFKFIELFEES